jgi:hypothetical protein
MYPYDGEAVFSPYELDFKQIIRNDEHWQYYLRPWVTAVPQKSDSFQQAAPTNITLNGRTMRNKRDTDAELERKGHDEMCPISRMARLMPILSTRGCVKEFYGLENNTAYESVRSADLAHRIHVQKMEQGVFDIEPLAPGITAAGNGIAAIGRGLNVVGWGVAVGVAGVGLGYGAATIIKALKKKE